VGVTVRVGVRVGVSVGVRVGVTVGVRVGVRVGVKVTEGVGGSLLESIKVLHGKIFGTVGVGVGVEVGIGRGHPTVNCHVVLLSSYITVRKAMSSVPFGKHATALPTDTEPKTLLQVYVFPSYSIINVAGVPVTTYPIHTLP